MPMATTRENPEWGMAHSYYLEGLSCQTTPTGWGRPSGANRPERAGGSAMPSLRNPGRTPRTPPPPPTSSGSGGSSSIMTSMRPLQLIRQRPSISIGVPRGGCLASTRDSTGDATDRAPTAQTTVSLGGIRQQINAITAYIDASNVYGSDEQRGFALRELDGSGRLRAGVRVICCHSNHGAGQRSPCFRRQLLSGGGRAGERAGRG